MLCPFLCRRFAHLFGVSVMTGWPAWLRVLRMISAHHLIEHSTSLLMCHYCLNMVCRWMHEGVWCCIHGMGRHVVMVMMMWSWLWHVVRTAATAATATTTTTPTAVYISQTRRKLELGGTEASTGPTRVSIAFFTNGFPQSTQLFADRWLYFLNRK